MLPLLQQAFCLFDEFLIYTISNSSARCRDVVDDIMATTRRAWGEGLMEARTLCNRGSVTFLFASKRLRIYSAWPRQRYRWTLQSRASLRDRLYRRLCLRQSLRAVGGTDRIAAHRTWMRELMATQALRVMAVVKGDEGWCGRNASSSVVWVLLGSRQREVSG